MLDEYIIFQDHKISLNFTRTYVGVTSDGCECSIQPQFSLQQQIKAIKLS